MEVVERPIALEKDREYELLLAKRSLGGIVSRGLRLGKQIRTPTQFEVCAGDFVISRRQIVHGACGIVPRDLDRAIVSNEYTVLRTNSDLLAEYLELLCTTPYLRRTFYHSSVGVHVEKMVFREREWFRYRIHYPPISEQHSIVRRLGAWQRAVPVTARLLTLARKRKAALMQDVLRGKRRIKEYQGKPWATKRLETVADINPEVLPEDTLPGAQFGYIDLSSVDQGRLVGLPRRVTFGEAPSRARRIVRQGDLLLSTVRPALLGHWLARDTSPDLICSTGFAVIRPKAPDSGSMLFHQLFGASVQRQLAARLAGSGFPAVPAADVRALRLVYPEAAEERAQLGALFDGMDREVDCLHRLWNAIDRQRKGVAELLLTGKLRVPEAVS